MEKQSYVWGVICLCQIGESRKLGSKKQEKRVTELRMK